MALPASKNQAKISGRPDEFHRIEITMLPWLDIRNSAPTITFFFSAGLSSLMRATLGPHLRGNFDPCSALSAAKVSWGSSVTIRSKYPVLMTFSQFPNIPSTAGGQLGTARISPFGRNSTSKTILNSAAGSTITKIPWKLGRNLTW